MNEVIYDAFGTGESRYGYTQGPLWVHVRADMGSREGVMGSHEWAVMGLESQAISAWVISILLLFLVKHVMIKYSQCPSFMFMNSSVMK